MSKTTEIQNKDWYPLRVTYGRAIKAKERLESHQIESFLPLQYKILVKKGKKIKELSPVINNLIFVKGGYDDIKVAIHDSGYIKFIYKRDNTRLIIPSQQMDHFIRVSNTYDEELLYFYPSEVNLQQGTPIRIHSKGDPLDGVEGLFLKVKGKREKRLVISINGIIAVAAAVNIDLLERIEQPKTIK